MFVIIKTHADFNYTVIKKLPSLDKEGVSAKADGEIESLDKPSLYLC